MSPTRTFLFIPIRALLACVAAVTLALALAACGGGEEKKKSSGGGAQAGNQIQKVSSPPPDTITIGSKNFEEQVLLGEIYGQALEQAGFKVKKDLNLGDAQVSYKALKRGNIDMYPEYMGTALTNFYKKKTDEVPKEVKPAHELLAQEAKADKVTALAPTKFENDYAPTMLTKKADELGIKTLSDLGPKSKDLRLAGFAECEQREDCLIGLTRTYGIKPKEFVSTEEKRPVLDNDQADIVLFFSTDGELTLKQYKRIEDDKGFFPPYNISMLVRDDAIEKLGPEGQKVIEQVQAPLDEKIMQELNSRIVLDKKKEAEVATEYLKEAGFIK